MLIKGSTIREVARVIGLLISSFPGVEFGPLHYHHLEWDKTEAVQSLKGDFDCRMQLSSPSINELNWWTPPEATNHIDCLELNRAVTLFYNHFNQKSLENMSNLWQIALLQFHALLTWAHPTLHHATKLHLRYGIGVFGTQFG